MLRYAVVLIMFFVISSCTLGPNYVPPNTKIPDKWKNSQSKKIIANKNKIQAEWWRQFHDDTLNKLIAQAIKNNLDMKLALSRINIARSNRANAFANLFPRIDGEVSPSRGNPGYVSFNKRLDIFQADIDASWEVDLFGVNRQTLKAKQAMLEASLEDQHDFLVTLLAEVARNYIEFRSLQTQLLLTKKNTNSALDIMQLTKSLYRAGIVSYLDVSRAKSEYEKIKSDLPLIQAQMTSAKNRLTTLLGQQPNTLDHELQIKNQIPWLKTQVLLNAPAAVILQRPDIRVAERNLAAATALQSAALAQYFPRLSLSAMYGIQHTNLFPEINIWNMGVNLAAPLINFGRIRSQVDLAKAQQQEAFYRYQQSVLNALEEVETNLSAYINADRNYQLLKRVTVNNNTSLKLAKERYEKGIATFIDVLEAQRSLYFSEIEVLKAKAATSEKIVAIYKSLGGGWQHAGLEL